MVPLARGPSSDDPAPNTTSRQILWVRRHRSQSVRKDVDIPVLLRPWHEARECLEQQIAWRNTHLSLVRYGITCHRKREGER